MKERQPVLCALRRQETHDVGGNPGGGVWAGHLKDENLVRAFVKLSIPLIPLSYLQP